MAYCPDEGQAEPELLGRYLPLLPKGALESFLEQNAGPGWKEGPAVVLDPFGASPHLAVALARRGLSVLVAVNNPVMRFLLDLAANPPDQDALQAALAELASSYRGSERLETHLQSLYLTECSRCHRQVPAQAFVWDKSAGMLLSRIYTCPCGESGEFPATPADQERASSLQTTDGLHRARALERVAAPDDPDRGFAREALECYPPRAVYALVTIINKLDGLDLLPDRRRALLALILSACDEANTLWPYPAERPRPRQLTIPPHYLEKNVWIALETARDLFKPAAPVPVLSSRSAQAYPGGVCIFEGPMRELAQQLGQVTLGAVVTILPRPNQAFWTFSALWASWLWGHAAAVPFQMVLHRRRYDWSWHSEALAGVFRSLAPAVPLNAPLFAILAEPEPAFLSAAMTAASITGFNLEGVSMRTRHDPLYLQWRRAMLIHRPEGGADPDQTVESLGEPETKPEPPGAVELLRSGLLSTLQQRGEPVSYLHLHLAGLSILSTAGLLTEGKEALEKLSGLLLQALQVQVFVHQNGGENPETGLWGLSDWSGAQEPLPDRLEVAAVQFLGKNPGCSRREIEAALNAEFPGLQTPSLALVRELLSSYAVTEGGGWRLRTEDLPANRRADLESAFQALTLLAARLSYQTRREEAPFRRLIWLEEERSRFAFYVLGSAVCGRLLSQAGPPSQRNLLVIPGGRSGLLSYKLRRDPRLRLLAESWQILKFRQLRRLADDPELKRENFSRQLETDPLQPPEQLKLF
jgi:hypothetical protein